MLPLSSSSSYSSSGLQRAMQLEPPYLGADGRGGASRVVGRLGQLCEPTMDKWEKYRAYAAKCERQATISATEAERDDWLRIAKAWLRLIPSYARTGEEDAFLSR